MDMQVEKRHAFEASGAGALKLLLPVDATARSRWGIQYAKTCRQDGRDVAAALLFVAEQVTSWQVLRFRTQEEIRRFQAERANHLLVDAARSLEQAGVPVQVQYREGDIAFHIVDVAEQLECDEIVLPLPHPRWARLISLDIAREVLRRQRSVPVTLVDTLGIPERGCRQ